MGLLTPRSLTPRSIPSAATPATQTEEIEWRYGRGALPHVHLDPYIRLVCQEEIQLMIQSIDEARKDESNLMMQEDIRSRLEELQEDIRSLQAGVYRLEETVTISAVPSHMNVQDFRSCSTASDPSSVFISASVNSTSPAPSGINESRTTDARLAIRPSTDDKITGFSTVSGLTARSERTAVALSLMSVAPSHRTETSTRTMHTTSSIKIETEIYLPPSLYNYGCAQLTDSTVPFRQKMHAAVLVLFLFIVQLLLCFAFEDTSSLLVDLRRWKPASATLCFYREMPGEDYRRSFENVSFIDFVAGTIALVLVGLASKSDDLETLRSMPVIANDDHCARRFLLKLLWVIRSSVIPAYVLIGSANVMASSENGVDIVMNAVQSTYLLELDNVLFTTLLDKELQIAYLRGKVNDHSYMAGTGLISASLLVVNICSMILLYSMKHFVSYDSQDGGTALVIVLFVTVRLIIFSVGDLRLHGACERADTRCQQVLCPCVCMLGQLIFGFAFAGFPPWGFGYSLYSEFDEMCQGLLLQEGYNITFDSS